MPKILIIDVETTGFLHQGGSLTEVGIVSLDLDSGDKEILFDKVIRPEGYELEDLEQTWIVQNGYMDAKEIMEGAPFETVKDEVQGIINAYEHGATAYNNAFDFGFLEHYGVEIPVKLACPMRLMTGICRLPNPHSIYRGYKWPKVEEAYDFIFPGNTYEEIHRGADDAYHEADIVKWLYDNFLFEIPENA